MIEAFFGLMRNNCLNRPNSFDPAMTEKLCPGKFFHRSKQPVQLTDQLVSGYSGFNPDYYSELLQEGAITRVQGGEVDSSSTSRPLSQRSCLKTASKL